MFSKLKDYFVGTFIGAILNVLAIPIIVRMISPEYFGLFSIFMIFYNTFSLVFSFGLEHFFMRYFFEVGKDKYLLTKIILKLILILDSIFIVGIYIIKILNIRIFESFFKLDNKLLLLFFIGAIIVVINKFSITYIRLQKKAKIYSKLVILGQFLNIIFIFAFYFLLKEKQYVLILSIIVSNFFVTLISIILELNFWKSVLNIKNYPLKISLKEMISYSYPMLIASLINIGYQSIDKLMLKKYNLFIEIGIYSMSMKVANLLNIIQQSFNALWLPEALEYYKNNEFSKIKYVNKIFTFAVTEIVGLIILFAPILKYVLSEEYENVIEIFPFLMFIPVIGILSEIIGVGIIFSKNSKYQTLSSLGALFLNIILNIFLIPEYHLLGAIIATIVSYLGYYFLKYFYSKKVFLIEFDIKKNIYCFIIMFNFMIINFIRVTVTYRILYYIIFFLILLPYIFKKEVKELENKIFTKIINGGKE
ncbi:MAG: lipopolysaccharide biosynthesis protein [Fusobacterium ulcerans]|uniref:lipopolysaccharide biosynthesis protein n=1 Tax=Fusobacterium ulcerans TaxID=861 RepID=UPI003A86026D